MRVGLISDTHGLLRPEAVEALAGVEHILHAGDIGSADVLTELGKIAPVTAVRGNNDKGRWAASLAEFEAVALGGRHIYMLHDVAELDLDPAAAGFAAVVAGHSHKPKIETREGVLFINPGSAGPRRFKLPVTVGLLEIDGSTLNARIRELSLRS
ncbi:MAG TPA: metallophosphoesterase family protein [Steroidobacteraceae bacterium]|nr:metallophosphoesterase family protein [Steroidobacteraceae bacterium]